MSAVPLKEKEAVIAIQEEGSHKPNITYVNEDKNVTTYYIPTYLVVLLKKFTRCDLGYGTVDVSMTIVLRFKVDHFNEDELNAVRSVKMRINEEEAVILDKDTSELKHIRGHFLFTIRVSRTVDFLPTMKAFPFDVHTLKMKFEMTSKTVIINGRSCIFRFNCHYNNEEGSMYSFKTGGDPKSDEVDRINELNLAYGKTSCYTPVEAKGKERYFPVVQINIPLYREPGFVLMSSVLPLFLLNILILAVFAIWPLDYYARGAVLALVLLCLFAFLPTYRKQIPVPTITCLDIAVCATLLVIFLVLLESFVTSFTNNLSRVILPVISAAIVVIMNSYIAIRYFQHLKRRKGMKKMPSYEKKSSAQFTEGAWECVGLVCPGNAQELALIRGSGASVEL